MKIFLYRKNKKKMTKEQIEKQIEKNRSHIHAKLESNLPIDLLYLRVRFLAEQNELLIKKLDKINDNPETDKTQEKTIQV